MSQYTNLKTEYNNTLVAFQWMQTEAGLVDNEELSDEMLTISTNLNLIEDWITAKEEEELLTTFLAAQKALMIEYGLVIEAVEVPVGYGESFGGTESAIRMSVSKDGVQAVKVFDTISVSESDL